MRRKEPNIIFLLVSIGYMFFNSVLLPEGLLYTTLLTPFFFVNLLHKKGAAAYFLFLLVSVLFAVVQLGNVESVSAYLKSFVLLQCVAVFTINAYCVLKDNIRLAPVMKILGTVNLVLLVLSLLLLFIPLLRAWVWYEVPISPGIPIIPRLKMFTYEASYYSLIIIPVFSYYLLRHLLLNSRPGILLISLTVSLVLSFSMGVLAGIGIALLLVYCLNLNELGRKLNLTYVAVGVLLLLAAAVILFKFFPHNILFERIRNVYTGKDTSARGRTYESFILAWNIAKIKSIWFGIGLGQLKLIGRDYIIHYYHYTQIPSAVRIPNAVAETLNFFGLAGIIVRFGTIIYFFIRSRVWDNYYRLLLFIFIFIYQFTGSFIFNIAEYVIWVMAFSPSVFTRFDRIHFQKKKVV
jgi:hypothetical protein